MNEMDLSSKEAIEKVELKERMSKIKNKYVVLSGKGGVGKSSIATNLAVGLALEGKKVGLLDVDIHGPSVPKMLNLEEAEPIMEPNHMVSPIYYSSNLKVMSIGFLLKNRDDAVVWRGPLKMTTIKQFLHDVNWGELDYLIIDCPPGTGDEPLSVMQLIENPDGAVIVTTPQDVALSDVRRSVKFCKMLNCKILGVVENMSGFICPHCNEKTDIFKAGGGFKMAKDMEIPFLGSVPLDINVVNSGDEGKPYIHAYAKSESAKKLRQIIEEIVTVSKE